MANGCLAGLGVPLVSFLLCRPPGSSGGAWEVPVLGSGLEFLFFCGLLASGEDMSLGRLSWLHEGGRVDNGG